MRTGRASAGSEVFYDDDTNNPHSDGVADVERYRVAYKDLRGRITIRFDDLRRDYFRGIVWYVNDSRRGAWLPRYRHHRQPQGPRPRGAPVPAPPLTSASETTLQCSPSQPRASTTRSRSRRCWVSSRIKTRTGPTAGVPAFTADANWSNPA